jgi:hypothetical protein
LTKCYVRCSSVFIKLTFIVRWYFFIGASFQFLFIPQNNIERKIVCCCEKCRILLVPIYYSWIICNCTDQMSICAKKTRALEIIHADIRTSTIIFYLSMNAGLLPYQLVHWRIWMSERIIVYTFVCRGKIITINSCFLEITQTYWCLCLIDIWHKYL